LSSSFNLEEAHASAAVLNAKLKPIAESPVDTTDPQWMEKMRRLRPLDEAGVRPEAESLLLSLLDAYASGATEQRAAIRELFRQHSAFRWATRVPQSAETAEGFRLRLIQLSVLTGIEDPRDLSLNLKQLLESAQAARIEIESICSEVAALSESPLREILSRMR